MVFWESDRVGSHAQLMKASLSIFSLFHQIIFEMLNWVSNKIV